MDKILLIEDDFYIADLYRTILQAQGFEVILAMDGAEGLELALSQPDLILLDIMLPKLNGLMVLKKLKSEQLTKNIPVVLLTNLGQESIIKAAFAVGAAGYLLKARLEPAELIKQVGNFLANPSFKMDPNALVLD